LPRITARSTSGGTGCSTCAAYTFTYNNAGDELTRVSTISGDTANGTTTFAYDQLDRVTTYTPVGVRNPDSPLSGLWTAPMLFLLDLVIGVLSRLLVGPNYDAGS
jgi:hypothetical protein